MPPKAARREAPITKMHAQRTVLSRYPLPVTRQLQHKCRTVPKNVNGASHVSRLPVSRLTSARLTSVSTNDTQKATAKDVRTLRRSSKLLKLRSLYFLLHKNPVPCWLAMMTTSVMTTRLGRERTKEIISAISSG